MKKDKNFLKNSAVDKRPSKDGLSLSGLSVRVVANARRNEVLREADALKVYLNAPATDGKANKALIGMLADYFSVKKSQVVILRGEKSRNKVVEVLDERRKCN